jgi:outer membrane protein assembly factor BamD (BamD/ComL family)
MLFLCACPAVRSAPYEETQRKHSWLSFSRPSEKTPAEQKAHADRLKSEGRLKSATRAYRALVITWPGSPEAPPAQLLYAAMLEKRGKLPEAFDEYQYLMEHYAGHFPYEMILKRQFEIASSILEKKKGRFLFFGGWKAPERAIPMFEKIVRNGPRWERAAEAQFLIGKAYELSMQEDLAVGAYLIAQQRYPDSPFAEEAAFGRVRCWRTLSSENPNDEESLEQAWTAVTIFLASHPESPYAGEARAIKQELHDRRAAVNYHKAVYYDRVAHKPQAALQSYRDFVRLFPNSEWTAAAQERMDALSRQVEKPK